jgi:hypothetical protein
LPTQGRQSKPRRCAPQQAPTYRLIATAASGVEQPSHRSRVDVVQPGRFRTTVTKPLTSTHPAPGQTATPRGNALPGYAGAHGALRPFPLAQRVRVSFAKHHDQNSRPDRAGSRTQQALGAITSRSDRSTPHPDTQKRSAGAARRLRKTLGANRFDRRHSGDRSGSPSNRAAVRRISAKTQTSRCKGRQLALAAVPATRRNFALYPSSARHSSHQFEQSRGAEPGPGGQER